MIHLPRAAMLALSVLLTVLVAMPALAAPGPRGPKDGPPGLQGRQPGNPIAHCLAERDDPPVEEPVEETTTVQVAVETTTPPVETTTPPPADEPGKGNRGIRDCVHATLKDLKGNPHADAVAAVAAEGIASGYPDGTFKPNKPVTRAQMASFLARALDLVAEGDSAFEDVAGNAHELAINAIVEAGIAEGFTDGTFKPNKTVTRAQMAAFLTRALDLLAEASTGLPDIEGNPHEQAIDAIVEAGIARGFADGTFKPNKPVTRGQMASFLTRALGL